jgi:phospholipid-binding lipoprotein MlaA
MLLLLPAMARAGTQTPLKEVDFALEKSASVEKEADLSEKGAGMTDRISAPLEEETGPEEIVEEEVIADPLEPWNRLVFTFNDRFYFWFFKPVARGYNSVIPEPVRISVRNFFDNLEMPVRFVNSLLQGRLESAGIELARFGINSTIGFGGLFDVARNSLNLERQEKDTGLTLGYYGITTGPYIIWPFLGPSSVRETVGIVGDGFLTPVNYVTPWEDAFALDSCEYFNYNALRLGEYEDLTESAIEPYIALRNAYAQHRKSLIRK